MRLPLLMATQLPENETSSDHAAGPRTKVTERWQRRELGGGSPPSWAGAGQRVHLLVTLMDGAFCSTLLRSREQRSRYLWGDAGVVGLGSREQEGMWQTGGWHKGSSEGMQPGGKAASLTSVQRRHLINPFLPGLVS